ncbi:MAG: SOS response-associated peptidase [Nevskiaceae bacterium]
MCSRYAFVPDSAAWADFRTALAEIADALLALPAQPKIAPTDRAPIVIQQPGTPPQLIHARWGFIPHWWSKKELPRTAFNARSEEAAGKPMWRDALRATRCLIPATSWFEWQHLHGAKIPHSLAPQAGPGAEVRGFMLAGLWSLWRPQRDAEPFATCAMLTTNASPEVERVHDRMPVVLAPGAWRAWLDPAMQDPAAALALLREHGVRAVLAVTVR